MAPSYSSPVPITRSALPSPLKSPTPMPSKMADVVVLGGLEGAIAIAKQHAESRLGSP